MMGDIYSCFPFILQRAKQAAARYSKCHKGTQGYTTHTDSMDEKVYIMGKDDSNTYRYTFLESLSNSLFPNHWLLWFHFYLESKNANMGIKCNDKNKRILEIKSCVGQIKEYSRVFLKIFQSRETSIINKKAKKSRPKV